MVTESATPMVQVNGLNNWTGLTEMPFEVIAERTLEIEAEGETDELSVSFGKPIYFQGKGWACLYRLNAMGRDHVSPARGADAVDALQQAFASAHKQLMGMRRMHKITLGGGEDLGFAPAGAAVTEKVASACPVMNGSMSL